MEDLHACPSFDRIGIASADLFEEYS